MKPIDTERWSEGRVSALRQWTDSLFSVQVQADVEPFQAGQFTKLAMVIGDEFVERPYSYVNPPGAGTLEFYFVTVPGGPLTQKLIGLHSADVLWVKRKPAGFLILNEVPSSTHLWLLATGTGIGPFLSILQTAEPWQRFERIVLVHAVRFAAELSFREIIDSLRLQHPEQFDFVPFVSREETDFALPGRVPAAITSQALEQAAGLAIQPDLSQVMLCGNPAMVDDTSKILQARGLLRNRRRTPGHITVENYW